MELEEFIQMALEQLPADVADKARDSCSFAAMTEAAAASGADSIVIVKEELLNETPESQIEIMLMSGIVIVGPCGSGKSTLVKGLKELGEIARSFSQEHRSRHNLWEKLNPDVLIYLDATFETISPRRKVTSEEYYEQAARLERARENCDLYISTDNLTIDEVLERALDFLSSRKDYNEHRMA